MLTGIFFGLTFLLTELALGGKARYVVAGLLGGFMSVLAVHQPKQAVIALLCFLTFFAELRRVLLYVADWSGADPFLLIGPGVAVLLVSRLVFGQASLPQTRLSQSIFYLILYMGLQILNPLQGGLLVGVAGSMFYVVPLLWFWIGREIADRDLVCTILLKVIVPIALLTAAMGIYQSFFGFLPHQQTWIDNHSYAAIMLAFDTARPFSTFTSGQEFAAYMGIGAAVATSYALAAGKKQFLLLLPMFLLAIFVQGSRGPILGFAGVIALLWAFQGANPQLWFPRFAVAISLGIAIGYLSLGSIGRINGSHTFDAAARHQIEGLTNPLNEEKSTAKGHASMKVNGVIQGFLQPYGMGLGYTTMAASKFGSGGVGTEVDLSNMFVSLGAPGGLLYLFVVVQIVRLAISQWARTRSATSLATGAVLVACFGQWLSGSMYSITPVVWILVGHMDAEQWWFDRGDLILETGSLRDES
tara:strand:- start:84014 stop:85429 length:1416 start_codon:yes stop_codon:yes gene_type:complete